MQLTVPRAAAKFEWPPRWLLVSLGAGLTVVGGLGAAVWRYAGPPVRESAVVTVLEPIGGSSGKWSASYTYRVRRDDGSESRMTFAEVVPRDSRFRVWYRRYTGSNHVIVERLRRCSGTDPC
jgi:hypothetical protein